MAIGKILLIDDDLSTVDFVSFNLKKRGYDVTTATLGKDAIDAIESEHYDLALLDLRLPDMDGLEVLQRIKAISPETEVVVFSGFATVGIAVEATKSGAFYFIEKPLDMDRLAVLIEKAHEHSTKSREIKDLRSKLSTRETYQDIVGGSKQMQDIFELIDSVAASDANILVLGESGTGKELIANAIHFRSLRAKKPFVKVNCSALPKDLIESELFGHTKGSFTGAFSDKSGLIEQANGGSLLLDEIGEMPISLQPKLLRVLQERVFRKVGSEKPQKADFRLISATNRDPWQSVTDGKLREDLYFRINTITIKVPPLRERIGDIQKLAEHFLRMFSAKYERPISGISPRAYERIFKHGWQGNVRELQNAIERAVLLCKGKTIEVENLPFGEPFVIANGTKNGNHNGNHISNHNGNGNGNHNGNGNGIHDEECDSNVQTRCMNFRDREMSFDELGEFIVEKIPQPITETNLDDIFEKVESGIVKAALVRNKGNKQATANLLGVYRPRLYNMIKKHGL